MYTNVLCLQNPYDHNARTRQGYNMIIVAAEYGRHDVLQYLLDSLSQIPQDDSRANILIDQEVQATEECGQMDTLLPCGTDDGYAESFNIAGMYVKVHHLVSSWSPGNGIAKYSIFILCVCR